MIMFVYRQVYPHFHRLDLAFPRLGQATCVCFVLWLPGSFDCAVFSTKDSVFFFLTSENLSSVYQKQSDWPICRIPGLNGRGLVNLHFWNPAVHFGSPNNPGRLHRGKDPMHWVQSPESKTNTTTTTTTTILVFPSPWTKMFNSKPQCVRKYHFHWKKTRNQMWFCCISVERKSVFSKTYSLQCIAAATLDQKRDNHACAFSLAGVSCFIFSRPRLNNASYVCEISAVAPLKKFYNP